MRRTARERAIQFLFQYDLNRAEDLAQALSLFWETHRPGVPEDDARSLKQAQNAETPAPAVDEAAVRAFAEPLIRGTLEHQAELDRRIQQYAKNWEMHRMAVVDRNILRLAIYEMLHREDIPPIVSINEAVDIAKKFSTEDSGKFVNGILDRVKGDLLRPARIVN